MATESRSVRRAAPAHRAPPYSEEAERGVLGSILLDSVRVMDLCIERQLTPDSFYVPVHRMLFERMLDLSRKGQAIDVLTLGERLRSTGELEHIGGIPYLEQLVDFTPTAAHAEYYIDIVRQKHLLRSIIECACKAETWCYESDESADEILARCEQAFLGITEGQHGLVKPWREAIREAIEHIERILTTRRGLSGYSTGFLNIDRVLNGLRPGEMIVLAARPSMGKTSLSLNIAENVALGKGDPERQSRPVGVFSLEMGHEQLVLRMLCGHAGVPAFKIATGYLSATVDHARLTRAASILDKAPIYLDDTGGLDITELRARARRMKLKYGVELIIVDYLQLLHAREHQWQGRQQETADISGQLKAMAKELRIPVIVLSQLSRAPEQRGALAIPKLSDLRDSGAIEQDADVVGMLRRPCKYPEDPEHEDKTLAILEIVKHRNGPTGVCRLNFDEELMRFTDRVYGVDEADVVPPQAEGDADARGGASE